MNDAAPDPWMLSRPMCETSKMPTPPRTAFTSAMTPSYCTGISHPAKGTMRAPSATWFSYRAVRSSGTSEVKACSVGVVCPS